MKRMLILALLLQGCASHTVLPEFAPGDVAIARNFMSYPQYNDTRVTITGDFKWRWIKGGNALRVYEITTIDGEKLAAQPFQLQKVRHASHSD